MNLLLGRRHRIRISVLCTVTAGSRRKEKGSKEDWLRQSKKKHMKRIKELIQKTD